VIAETVKQNAEAMSFPDATFGHVNCQGVIHHTPDTEGCIREIARVLRPNGTASISVYYRNVLLSLWPWISWIGRSIARLGGKLRGRGREEIFLLSDVDELVRTFDGKHNPIGKCYSRRQFLEMLQPYFHVKELFLHFFPARALPFPLPRLLHSRLDGRLGFLIYANVMKLG